MFLHFEIPPTLSLLMDKFGFPPVPHMQYHPGEGGGKTPPWEGGKYGGAPIRHKGEVKESLNQGK